MQSAKDQAREKWHNFLQRFLPELQAAEFTDEQLTTTWDEMAVFIQLAWLYRPVVEDRDEETLRGALLASGAPNTQAILRVWDGLAEERKTLFWRYAKLFFNTVLC